MKKVFFNPEAQRVSFLDSRFYACNDKPALYVPSSTTILNVAPKSSQFYEWLKRAGETADAHMAERMEVGSKVHNLTEVFDKTGRINLAENGVFDMRMEEVAMIHRYAEFVERFKPEMELIEAAYAHSGLGFGGTLDRRAKIKGDRWLFDIKTGNIYPYYWCQLASYVVLHNMFNPDTPIERVGILHLNAKTRTEGKPGTMQGIGWQMIEMSAVEGDQPGLEFYTQLFYHYKKIWHHHNPNMEPDSPMFSTVIERSYAMPSIIDEPLPNNDPYNLNF